MKGDEESNGLIENAIMLLRGIIRTAKCHIESRTQEPVNDDSLVMPWVVEHAGCILSSCQKRSHGKTPFEAADKKNYHRFDEQDEPQISARSLTRNAKQQCRVFHRECRRCVQSSRNWRLEPQDRWDTEAINNVIGVPRRMTDGRWTVGRPEAQVDPIPIPPLPFEGARVQRERITKQDINEFGATIGCPGCNAIKGRQKSTSTLRSLQNAN